MEALKKKYPYADMSRFIESDIVKGGKAYRGVFFGLTKDEDYIYIEDPEFKENKDYMKYLTSNKSGVKPIDEFRRRYKHAEMSRFYIKDGSDKVWFQGPNGKEYDEASEDFWGNKEFV